jgi:uncharacterized protein YqgC (DUF456 family)
MDRDSMGFRMAGRACREGLEVERWRAMDGVWWILTIGLMLAGLAGTVIPLLPGTVLILGGAVLNHFTLHSIGWPTLIVLTGLMVLAQLLDLVSGAAGAKYFGATRWGAIGGILGAVVGLFFGFIGIFVGPLVGALIGELLGGKGILPAGKSTWGTFLGTTAGIIGKLAIGLLMIGWFAVAALI